MSLSHYQKKYIQKHIRTKGLSKTAADLKIEEKQVKNYLKDIWDKNKYHKFFSQNQSHIPPFNFPSLKLIFRKSWKIFLLLIALVLFTYTSSLSNAFVSDDKTGFALAKSFWDKNQLHYSGIFPGPQNVLFYAIYKLFGLNPAAFRFGQIIMHLGSTWLVYLIVFLLVNPTTALFTSVLFAIHPLLSESVVWLSSNTYLHYSFFFLLSFLLYILYSFQKSTVKKTLPHATYYMLYAASVILFFFSLLASERAVVLSLIFIVLESSRGSLKKNWKQILPFLLLSCLIFTTALFKIGQRATQLQTEYYGSNDLYNPLIQIPVALSSYIELFFWPDRLTLYHSEMALTWPIYIFKLSVALILLATLVISVKRNRLVFFWLSFYIISLMPTLTPVKIAWVVAERYVYLGSIGLMVIIAYSLNLLAQKQDLRQYVYLFFAVLVIILSVRTTIRNIDWLNEDNLWVATARTSPSSPNTHNNLGDVYSRRGDLQKAASEFTIATKINPRYAEAYHNLARTQIQMNKVDEAIKNYQQAIKLNPKLWQSFQDLASIYFHQKKYKEALKSINKAIEVNSQEQSLLSIKAQITSKLE